MAVENGCQKVVSGSVCSQLQKQLNFGNVMYSRGFGLSLPQPGCQLGLSCLLSSLVLYYCLFARQTHQGSLPSISEQGLIKSSGAPLGADMASYKLRTNVPPGIELLSCGNNRKYSYNWYKGSVSTFQLRTRQMIPEVTAVCGKNASYITLLQGNQSVASFLTCFPP